MAFRSSCLSVALLMFAFCSQCYAESSRHEPLFYLKKALENIEQLKTGEVDIHITIEGYPSYGENKEITCFLAFDLPEDRYFYRRSDERNEYANDGAGFHIHDTQNSHVSIRHPAMGGYSSSPRAKLDPRAIGLFTYRMLWQHQSYPDSKKMFLQRDFVDISEETGDLAFEAGQDRRASHGYSTRQVIRVSRDTGNIDSIFLESSSYDTSGKAVLSWSNDQRFSWKEVGGISVLSHFVYESKIDFVEEGVDTTGLEEGIMSVRLDWKSINKEMSQDTFSYKAFDLGDDTVAWDLRGSDPILVKARKKSIKAQTRRNSKEQMTSGETKSGILFIWIVNGSLLFLLAIYLLSRKIYFRYTS